MDISIDREKVVKEYEDYVNSYISLITSHDYEFEMHKAVLTLLKEQEDCIKILTSDLEEVRKEHQRLLDKKIPLITNGQEVVRCKDCKDNNQCSIQFKFADADNPGDWFCAYGKRRDDDA